jgi:hypothetical protein
LMWFLLATLLLAGRRRGGVVVMSVYLVMEAGFLGSPHCDCPRSSLRWR